MLFDHREVYFYDPHRLWGVLNEVVLVMDRIEMETESCLARQDWISMWLQLSVNVIQYIIMLCLLLLWESLHIISHPETYELI